MTDHKLTRREFLTQAGAAGVGLMALGAAPLLAAEDKRPNIVFIISDDHRWDVMSCAGHPFMKTPNMDRLATEGALFSNAFVTTSLCSPSRGCFLTSKYVHHHGVATNSQPFPTAKETTWPQLLKKSGYETAYVGKWHMDGQTEVQPGFDRWVSFKAHGRYVNPQFIIDGKPEPQNGHMTDLLTKYAVDWIKQDHKAPFLLYLGHKAPHAAPNPEDRNASLYAEAKIEPPANSTDSLVGKPKWVGEFPKLAHNAHLQRGPEAYRQAILDYCRTTQGIDDSIGQLLKTLEETGKLDNTIFIYCSDNGYFLGDHGLWDKRAAYEESLRIPFLVRYPKMIKAGRVVDQMIHHLDVAPTMLDLAGVSIPSDMQGKSMRSLFDGSNKPLREDFLYEYWQEKPYPEFPSLQAVRTTDWKYIENKGDIPELYDLRNDSTELNNLAQDPKYADKLKEMKQRLERLKKETGYKEI